MNYLRLMTCLLFIKVAKLAEVEKDLAETQKKLSAGGRGESASPVCVASYVRPWRASYLYIVPLVTRYLRLSIKYCKDIHKCL